VADRLLEGGASDATHATPDTASTSSPSHLKPVSSRTQSASSRSSSRTLACSAARCTAGTTPCTYHLAAPHRDAHTARLSVLLHAQSHYTNLFTRMVDLLDLVHPRDKLLLLKKEECMAGHGVLLNPALAWAHHQLMASIAGLVTIFDEWHAVEC